MKRLDAVNQTLSLIEAKLMEAETKTSNADKTSKDASNEIDLADRSIGRSWFLVEKIRGPDNRTAKIIEQIYKVLNNWTKTTIRISETIKEVRKATQFNILYCLFYKIIAKGCNRAVCTQMYAATGQNRDRGA